MEKKPRRHPTYNVEIMKKGDEQRTGSQKRKPVIVVERGFQHKRKIGAKDEWQDSNDNNEEP
eukprot:CAMPEP_0197065714 /NCGR_PEP_ID=MMETSP1384-20130603/168825_1 /TAXON_ID=29189 /ORGANISM="Ammonia sp." /LENGTH=61 /DNA_ID=CAMNT_0042502647 /DNA_START=1 /DNA_END=182 /DNA_ORIENTATION=-